MLFSPSREYIITLLKAQNVTLLKEMLEDNIRQMETYDIPPCSMAERTRFLISHRNVLRIGSIWEEFYVPCPQMQQYWARVNEINEAREKS